MTQDQQRIMGYFIEEAREHLQTIEQGILNLQDVIRDQEGVNELFRAAHSIKGGAAMLGVSSIQHISHRLEDFFGILRDNHNINVDEHLTSLLLTAFDPLQELLDELQSSFHIDEAFAETALRQLSPVFTDLEQHLETLRQKSSSTTSLTVNASDHAAHMSPHVTDQEYSQGTRQTVAESPSGAESVEELFQAEVNDSLREMLQLFKGADDSDSRYNLQELANRIHQYGIKFGIPAWGNLLGKVEQALGNTAFGYREIAPVVIREIKQAQEKFINGEGHQILPSQALLDLVPKRALVLEDDEISMIFGAADASADDDISMGLSLDQVLSRRQWELPQSVEQSVETLNHPATVSQTVVGQPTVAVNSNDNIDELLVNIPAMDWGDGGISGTGGDDEADVDGPKIGESELKTLANLFDNEDIDFEAAWEDIESNETQVANQANGLPDDDSLADLLGTSGLGNLSDGEEDPDPQMMTLLGDEFADSVSDSLSGLFPADMADLDGNLDLDITSSLHPVGALDELNDVLFPDDITWDESESRAVNVAEQSQLPDIESVSDSSEPSPEEDWNSFADLFDGATATEAGGSDALEQSLDVESKAQISSDSTPFDEANWDLFSEEEGINPEDSEEVRSYEFEDETSTEFDDGSPSLSSALHDEMDEFSSDDLYHLDQVGQVQGDSNIIRGSGETVDFDFDPQHLFDDQDLVNFANQLKGNTGDDPEMIDPSVDTLVEEGFSLGFADAVIQADDPQQISSLEQAASTIETDLSPMPMELDELGFSEQDLYGHETASNQPNDDYGLLDSLFATTGDDDTAPPVFTEASESDLWSGFDDVGDDGAAFNDPDDLDSLEKPKVEQLDGFADLWESESDSNDDSLFMEKSSLHTYEQSGNDFDGNPLEKVDLNVAENLNPDTLDPDVARVNAKIDQEEFDLGAEFLDGISPIENSDTNASVMALEDSAIDPIADAMAALEQDVFLGHGQAGGELGGNLDGVPTDWEGVMIDQIFDMDLSSEDLSVLENIPRAKEDHHGDDLGFGNSTIDNLVDFFDSEEVPEANDSNEDLSNGNDVVTGAVDTSFYGTGSRSEVNSGITSEASYSMDQTNQNLGAHNQSIGDDLDLDALAALIDEPTVLFEANAATQATSHDNLANFDSLDDLEALINSQAAPVATPASSAAPQFADTSGETSTGGTKSDDFADLENFLGTMYQKDVGPMVTKTTQRSTTQKRQKSTDGTMRVDVRHLDSLNNLVGELVVNRNLLEQDQERLQQSIVNLLHQVQLLSDVAQRMRDQYDRSLLEASLAVRRSVTAPIFGGARNQGLNHDQDENNSSVTSDFDGIEFDRYTTFHVLSQEIIELTVKIRESASDIEFVVSETEQVTRQLGMITTQIQDDLKQSRMVPFAQIADVLPRGVRDRAIKSGKQAELEVHGRETLIDKAILEELKDPLIHIVNNAVDHGLENMSTRTSNGKPAAGKVTVRAYHQGNQTIISISDDGGGIDPVRVKESAVRKGVRTQADVNRLTDNEVYALLFEPGFSTAAKADEFKGRGVGLDVVKTALDDIRGSMMIESDLGKGTTFTIRLPLTLSISRAIFCISDRARVAFPVDGFEDMVEVPQSRIIINEQGQTCLPWRDAILPFQHLSNLLTYNRHISRSNIYGKQENDEYCIIILRNETSYLAVQVDQFLGEFEIVIKQLEGPIPKPVGIAGATVLGDGKVMAIANVLELFDIASGRLRPLTSSEPKQVNVEVEAAIDPTVLIVDDSITVRELLSLTFAKVGYRVEQAKDGQDAWEKLRAGLPCDLIFCDIEMPRMDGLELLSRLQKDGRLSQIPVAMLTSRGADRHRQTAVQYGAKGYFTKPYLEEELLSASNRLLKGENLVS